MHLREYVRFVATAIISAAIGAVATFFIVKTPAPAEPANQYGMPLACEAFKNPLQALTVDGAQVTLEMKKPTDPAHCTWQGDGYSVTVRDTIGVDQYGEDHGIDSEVGDNPQSLTDTKANATKYDIGPAGTNHSFIADQAFMVDQGDGGTVEYIVNYQSWVTTPDGISSSTGPHYPITVKVDWSDAIGKAPLAGLGLARQSSGEF